MLNKLFKVSLVSILSLSLVAPGLNAFADDTDTKKPTEEETKKEGDTVTGTGEDSKPVIANVSGIDTGTAGTMRKDIHKFLVDIGGTGQPLVSEFSIGDKKIDNTKLFNSIILNQLQLYELLYATGTANEFKSPITSKDTVAAAEDFKDLTQYIIAYEAINNYLDTQLTMLESSEGADPILIEALKSAKINTEVFKSKEISEKKVVTLESIRTYIQKEINTKTSHSINTFIKYLNKGEGPQDIKALTNADTKEATKDMITLLKQWSTLPHIKDATDDMKLTGISEINQEWLEALKELADSMETDNGGTTDKDKATAGDNTNPELATSVLGRLGSSLFTVSRADNADDDPNKPLTNTLSWNIIDHKNNQTYDPGPAAKDDMLAMFAATAMYTPFVSRIGDKDYLEAYKSLFKEGTSLLPDDAEEVRFKGNSLGPIDILNQVQNLKKPLYYFTDLNALGKNSVYGHSTEDVKGVASLLTVGDLINIIKRKSDMAAITVHGVMEKDGDSWAFYNYSLNKDGQVETAGSDSKETKQVDNNTVVAGIPIANKVPADKKINGGQDNTRVIFEMTFNEKMPGAGLLTGALMHNIYNDTMLKSKFTERAQEAVYVDAIGNIVLNDGLVVLPAAANPTYWSIPNGMEGTEYETETWTYNPFTVAFMDTYPAIYQGGTVPSSVNEKKDKNKYILSGFTSFSSGFIVTPLKKGFKNTFTKSRTAGIYRTFKLETDSAILQEDIIKGLDHSIGVDDKENVADTSWWEVGSANPLQMRNLVTLDGDSIFPYLTSKITDPFGQESFDTDYINYRSSVLIAKNMYAYILGQSKEEKSTSAANGKDSGGSSVGILREGFLFNNVTMPVLTGITNGVEFDKSNAKSDLLKAGGDANLVEKWVLNFSKWLAVAAKSSKNILAISNSDEVSLLKVLYGAFVDYGYYILFTILVVLIILFVREGDFMRAALKGFMILSLLFTTLFIIPLGIPWITGVTSAPLSKGTVLNSMMSKLEMSEKVNSMEPAGSSGLSVKLYNMSPKQAKEINEQYMVTDSNYLTNKFSINDNLGLYVHGTELRLDLYSFWRFDPLIISTADGVTEPNDLDPQIPQIYHSDHSQAKFMVTNDTAKNEMAYNNDLVDYYMPFNLLENGLMKTLNTYLVYYNPPQSVIRYPDGLVKSSYIMNTYMKSLAFLSAEPNIADLISKATEEDEYSHRGLDKVEVDVVNQKFYPYGDILNLQSWVDTEWADLPENYANSLWIQSMVKSGYYIPGSGIEKRLALANKVNRKAYDIIIQMKDTKGLVSDESMVKLVSLYTTFEWNKEISFINNNTFPKTSNLNEVSASDILAATVLGQSRQFIFYDTSIISGVFLEDGLLGVIFVDVALIALVVYSIFLSWILPTMIVGLLGYAVYLILTNRKVMPALVFTFKLTMLAVVMNLALVIVIVSYNKYDNLYILTPALLVVCGLFGWLFYRFIFKRKSKFEKSWQRKHLNQMYGDDYYGNSRYDRGSHDAGGMQDYLQESGGVSGGRETYSSRY